MEYTSSTKYPLALITMIKVTHNLAIDVPSFYHCITSIHIVNTFHLGALTIKQIRNNTKQTKKVTFSSDYLQETLM